MGSILLSGRYFYLRKKNALGTGVRVHIRENGLKDLYDPEKRVVYLISEAVRIGTKLIVPMVVEVGTNSEHRESFELAYIN